MQLRIPRDRTYPVPDDWSNTDNNNNNNSMINTDIYSISLPWLLERSGRLIVVIYVVYVLPFVVDFVRPLVSSTRDDVRVRDL
jgi:hypothetical protein